MDLELSEDQKRAVLSKSRYNRILAGAGAGKTETLTRRIAYLLLVKKVEPMSIVAFTFTEKAAQSMKSRIYQRIGEISGPSAAAKLGEMYVGTIHAYAKRILEDHFGFGNHGVLNENQETAFLMRHGWSLGIQEYGRTYAESCRNFLRTVNMVWGEMLDEEKLKRKAPKFYEKLMRYEEILEEHKLLTFGRMIYQVVLNLRKNPDIDVVSFPEGLRGGHKKILPIPNNLADIVRQTAIGKRNMFSSLKENNLGVLIQPARSSSSSSPTGDASDYQ